MNRADTASDTRSRKPGSAEQRYTELLRRFNAERHTNRECVDYLISEGFTAGQARNAVYRFMNRNRIAARTEGTVASREQR
jgi:hypothetical protein